MSMGKHRHDGQLARDLFLEMLDLVGENFSMGGAPSLGAKACLKGKVGEKSLGLGQLLPDLGQEGGTGPANPENNPVDIGSEQGENFLAAGVFEGDCFAEDGNFNFRCGKLRLPEGAKTVIIESGVDGVIFDAACNGVSGGNAADTAPELSGLGQGHKDSLVPGERRAGQGLCQLFRQISVFLVKAANDGVAG